VTALHPTLIPLLINGRHSAPLHDGDFKLLALLLIPLAIFLVWAYVAMRGKK